MKRSLGSFGLLFLLVLGCMAPGAVSDATSATATPVAVPVRVELPTQEPNDTPAPTAMVTPPVGCAEQGFVEHPAAAHVAVQSSAERHNGPPVAGNASIKWQWE